MESQGNWTAADGERMGQVERSISKALPPKLRKELDQLLEDTDGDGRYDKQTLFADGLSFPTGLLTWRDGVIVTAAPEILFLRDTDGDGKADSREVLVSGLMQGNQQLRANGLRWGLDGWVYCAAGGHHRGHGAGNKITSTRRAMKSPSAVTASSRIQRTRAEAARRNLVEKRLETMVRHQNSRPHSGTMSFRPLPPP
jgi:glucose/arabinose dehydrogenase